MQQPMQKQHSKNKSGYAAAQSPEVAGSAPGVQANNSPISAWSGQVQSSSSRSPRRSSSAKHIPDAAASQPSSKSRAPIRSSSAKSMPAAAASQPNSGPRAPSRSSSAKNRPAHTAAGANSFAAAGAASGMHIGAKPTAKKAAVAPGGATPLGIIGKPLRPIRTHILVVSAQKEVGLAQHSLAGHLPPGTCCETRAMVISCVAAQHMGRCSNHANLVPAFLLRQVLCAGLLLIAMHWTAVSGGVPYGSTLAPHARSASS